MELFLRFVINSKTGKIYTEACYKTSGKGLLMGEGEALTPLLINVIGCKAGVYYFRQSFFLNKKTF